MPTPAPDDLITHPFDEDVSISAWPMPLRLEYFLTQADPTEWWASQAIETFAYYRSNTQTWGHICAIATQKYISVKRLEAAVADHLAPPVTLPYTDAHPGLEPPPPTHHTTEALANATEPWREYLQCTKQGEPKETIGNIGLILHNHPEWAGLLWWDCLRGRGMYKGEPITDDFCTECAQWLCVTMRMPVRSPRLVERALRAECHKIERDPLKEWLHALPAWDGTERLDHWLCDACDLDATPYAMGISRVIPLAMIARALDPGCLYRYVVILEGPEEIGKSSMVRALAGDQGYVELSMALESKEAHMILRGAWVAELAELDSLSRTEDTRLKSFITMREDTYVPKYSNDPISIPRRTIFIGTTNEDTYLKGQTGNSRFLPIKLEQPIDVKLLTACREQLLAEALTAYQATPTTWWQLSDDALTAAAQIRKERRVVNEYEDPLRDWLDRQNLDTVTWAEIAQGYLEIPSPERWKYRALQMQISAALRAIGWVRGWVSPPGRGRNVRGYLRGKS